MYFNYKHFVFFPLFYLIIIIIIIIIITTTIIIIPGLYRSMSPRLTNRPLASLPLVSRET